jgi:hypothetical protein
MSFNYFTIQEFTAEDLIPPAVANKIMTYHIFPMNEVREIFNAPIHVSQASGYRSVEHELKKGRSGESEHCFRNISKGAADYTAGERVEQLGVFLLNKSPYTRICYYPASRFYHCDYKSKNKQYFVCNNGRDWIKQ